MLPISRAIVLQQCWVNPNPAPRPNLPTSGSRGRVGGAAGARARALLRGGVDVYTISLLPILYGV